MNRAINLMSERARIRQSLRIGIRRWSRILMIVLAILALHALVVWWPTKVSGLDRAALEAQYEPIRLMKLENGELSKKIAESQQQNPLELALAARTPVLTLIGLVGLAVEGSNGQVFLEQIDYQQSNLPSQPTVRPQDQLVLTGIGANPESVKLLVERLKQELPSVGIQIRQIETIQVNQQVMQSFQILCTL